MPECPYCGGDESKCDFSFFNETCSQMSATQDNRACAVLADGSVVWDEAAAEILKQRADR